MKSEFELDIEWEKDFYNEADECETKTVTTTFYFNADSDQDDFGRTFYFAEMVNWTGENPEDEKQMESFEKECDDYLQDLLGEAEPDYIHSWDRHCW